MEPILESENAREQNALIPFRMPAIIAEDDDENVKTGEVVFLQESCYQTDRISSHRQTFYRP